MGRRTRDTYPGDDEAVTSVLDEPTERLPLDQRAAMRIASGPGTDPVSVWMHELTILLEQVVGRVEAVEKSVDGQRTEVRSATDTAKLAAKALERIAKAEEDQVLTNRERLKDERERDRVAKKTREKWLTRIWESQPFQMLMTGAVLAVLQFLGVAYLVTKLGGGSGG